MGTNSLLETPASQASVVEASEEVREAALYLDRVKPDWWARIDPVKLDMDSPCHCIAGQNHLDYDEANAELGYFGDDQKGRDVPGPFGSNPALAALWLEEIASRMPDSARLAVGERANKTGPAVGRVRSGGRT